MYSLKRLARIAAEGLREMAPALRVAWNADPGDDRMSDVYGPAPRLTALLIGLACVVAGEWFARSGPDLPLGQYVHWPAVLVAGVFAAVLRRYLFVSGQARAEDFSWLAASVAPAFALAVVAKPLASAALGPAGQAVSLISIPESPAGLVIKTVTDATGLAAVLTIALATLCFSKRWFDALVTLAVRLFVFNLMIWVTALVMLELDLVSRIVGGLIHALTGWRLPPWAAELADVLGYALLLMTAYLAVIGGTWTVSRRKFSELLERGEADVLSELQRLIEKSPAGKAGTGAATLKSSPDGESK